MVPCALLICFRSECYFLLWIQHCHFGPKFRYSPFSFYIYLSQSVSLFASFPAQEGLALPHGDEQ